MFQFVKQHQRKQVIFPSSLLLLLLLLLLAAGAACIRAATISSAASSLVDRLSNLHRGILHVLDLRLDRLQIIAILDCSQIRNRGLNLADDVRWQLLLVLVQALLRAVQQRVRVVLRLNERLALLVLTRKRLRVANHLLNLVVAQTAAALDRDVLLLVRSLVLRADVHDAIRVDVERHLDLRHATRRGRNSHEVEVAEQLVVRRHLALALEHLDAHLRLVVRGGGEHLRLLRGDGGVAPDEAREDAAERLDAEAERRHVKQQDVLDVSAQHTALDRRSHRDALVGVHALVRILSENLLDELLHLWHARHSTDEEHLRDVRLGDARILEAVQAWLLRSLEEGRHDGLELASRERHVQVLGT
mmetsp:Transcript_7595/g.19872  ORF Transcript_7595/g.19872 Transcript_7595/m.19872 type:complete len:360 (-) Transcript_7595:1228-2307(-)